MKGVVAYGTIGNIRTYTSAQSKELDYDVQAALIYMINYSCPIYNEFKKKECL